MRLLGISVAVTSAVLIRLGIELAQHIQHFLLAVLGISILGGIATYKLVPVGSRYTLKAGLKGRDINKRGTPAGEFEIPESLGLVSGTLYLLCIISVLLWTIIHHPDESTEHFNAALHSVVFALFLGFADDVLDIPWRAKMVLPIIAIFPLIIAYSGVTYVRLPISPFKSFPMPSAIDLGHFYRVYMLLLAVFSTNAINIYAGINGLEISQSIVIALAIVVHNLVELNGPSAAAHMTSIVLILPFIGTSAGLLYWNWYPSRAFVGDTYTLFAGMVLAAAGILGHFSKTLLLFFIPQVLNFLYSTPQLFGFIPISRHRLPVLNKTTGKLEGQPQHMNLVNLTLRILGPMHEETLCTVLVCFQLISCIFGLFCRYYVSTFFYN